MATRFGAAGMKVVLADIEKAALDDVVAELGGAGVEAVGVPTDVSDGAAVEALRDAALERFGGIHVACNNAGVATGGRLWEQTVDDWKWVLGVNLWGVIHGVRTFVPVMLRQGEGHVVNTASMAGLTSPPFMGVYNVTKHAVVTLSETLHAELSMETADIGVSVLCPGWVKTRIGEADRNRPGQATFADAAEEGDQAMFLEVLSGFLANGLEPPDVAEQVFDGGAGPPLLRADPPGLEADDLEPGREHRQRTGSAAGDAPRGLTRDQRGGSGSPRGGRESRPRVSCTTGPIVSAKTTVPMPTVPPRAQPTASARQLDPGPDEPDRAPAAGHPGHDPVPRSRAETGADVEADADAGDADAAEQHRPLLHGPARLRQPGQHQIHDRPDEHRVEDRPDAGPLAQRDPHEQEHEPGDDGDHADRQPGPVADALVEDVPRVEAEVGLHEQREADAAQHEAGDAPGQPPAGVRRARGTNAAPRASGGGYEAGAGSPQGFARIPRELSEGVRTMTGCCSRSAARSVEGSDRPRAHGASATWSGPRPSRFRSASTTAGRC